MIQAIGILGFKSVADASLPLHRLTLLVGANASGKSNVLEAVQLLAWLSRGQPLGELSHAMREGTLPLRGLLADLPRRDGDRRIVTLEMRVDDLGLVVTLHIGEDRPRIEFEGLHEAGVRIPLYEVVTPATPPSHDLAVAYNNFTKGGHKPIVTCVDDQAVFLQLSSPARYAPRHDVSRERVPMACQRISGALHDVLFLDPRPAGMRGYAFRGDPVLTGDGSNLSAVLYRLIDEGRREELLAFVRQLPEQEIQDIDFIETPRNEVMVVLLETFGRVVRKVEAALLSDGTLRVLAVAAALLSVPDGSTVIIEEIDNGVHPSRTRQLLELLDATASRRNLQVLITTHNPALQDDLPRSALPHVVACYRDRDDGTTKLVALGDLPRYSELVARGPLGQLTTRRTLDHFLPGHRDERAAPPMDLSFLAEPE